MSEMESTECCCPECQKGKKRYVQILDIDRYINALNVWGLSTIIDS